MNEKSGGLLDSASDAAHKVGSKASDAAHKVGSKAHDAYDTVADKARPLHLVSPVPCCAVSAHEMEFPMQQHGVASRCRGGRCA